MSTLKEIRFTSPIPPSVNSYLGKRVAYNSVTNKPYVHIYETKEAKDYKRYMKLALERAKKKYGWERTDKHTYVVCEITVFINTKRKDSDNMFKCLLDTIVEANLVYDDSMIMPRVTNIFIDKDKPRLEVRMYVSEKVGIFKDRKTFEIFEESNCKTCNRYARNCSIRREALENKLKTELETISFCANYKPKKGES